MRARPRPRAWAEYRLRHAQYKTDPALQAAHAAFPWAVTFDDNDVANNWAGDHQSGSPPGEFAARRAAALQAFWEHQPLRLASKPGAGGMRMHRRLGFGRLAQMHVLDTRSYRTPQPCGDGIKDRCPEAYDPDRTMLGPGQED
jgi:alkaline phosphatase D